MSESLEMIVWEIGGQNYPVNYQKLIPEKWLVSRL